MASLRDLLQREPRHGIELPAWLDRIISIGIVTQDPAIARRQRCVNVGAFATSLDTFSHLVFLAFYDFRDLLIINAHNLLMTVAPLLVPRLHRFGENVGAVTLILMILAGNSFVVWTLGRSSDVHVYFTLAGAMLLLLGVHKWRLVLFLFSLYVIALITALNFAPERGYQLPDDAALRQLLSGQVMISTIIITGAMLFYALTLVQRAEIELQDQYERSEALIGIVMPPPIAARLKSGREARIADRIETLSVMFADLAGFTGAAHDLPPAQVVEFLDQLVRTFDTLAERHRVEKIKTIGDSYMAGAGFDADARAGALATGRLALAMIAAIAHQPPLAGRKLNMRIGIHCGEATAGIIGETRFSYDVWGDAVNVASRMESTGVAGRIQVSDAYRALTEDAFVFEERGPTDLKGIGAVRTFFLTGEREASGPGGSIAIDPSDALDNDNYARTGSITSRNAN
jgi:adenylate cyclase